MDNHVSICAIFFVYFVVYDYVLFFRNLIFFHVRLYVVSGSICWGVIDVYQVVVLVLLLEKGVEISEVKPVIDIVVRGDKDTDSDLIMNVLVDLIFLIVVLFFLF